MQKSPYIEKSAFKVCQGVLLLFFLLLLFFKNLTSQNQVELECTLFCGHAGPLLVPIYTT